MNSSVWGVFLFALGMIGIAWMAFFGGIIADNERNYYSLKEVTQAAIYDSLDGAVKYLGIGYDGAVKGKDPYMHCETGNTDEQRIRREKFVESFVRRFADTAFAADTTYEIQIHDIIECPVLVNVTIRAIEDRGWLNNFLSVIGVKSQPRNMFVDNEVTGILESRDAFVEKKKD